MYVHHVPVWFPERSEVRSEAGETSSYDPCWRCWEPNPSPQHEEQMLLTAEPTLQLPGLMFSKGDNLLGLSA